MNIMGVMDAYHLDLWKIASRKSSGLIDRYIDAPDTCTHYRPQQFKTRYEIMHHKLPFTFELCGHTYTIPSWLWVAMADKDYQDPIRLPVGPQGCPYSSFIDCGCRRQFECKIALPTVLEVTLRGNVAVVDYYVRQRGSLYVSTWDQRPQYVLLRRKDGLELKYPFAEPRINSGFFVATFDLVDYENAEFSDEMEIVFEKNVHEDFGVEVVLFNLNVYCQARHTECLAYG